MDWSLFRRESRSLSVLRKFSKCERKFNDEIVLLQIFCCCFKPVFDCGLFFKTDFAGNSKLVQNLLDFANHQHIIKKLLSSQLKYAKFFKNVVKLLKTCANGSFRLTAHKIPKCGYTMSSLQKNFRQYLKKRV